MIEDLLKLGGTVIVGGALIKATDILFGEQKIKSIWDEIDNIKSIHNTRMESIWDKI